MFSIEMVVFRILVLALALVAASSAHPAFHKKTKRTSLAEVNGGENGPLEDVSRVLERFARQIASTPNAPKRWNRLHREVLRAALQVTKQLLGYEGWTPNHLELLKGEQEILYEHVADETGAEGPGDLGRTAEPGVPDQPGGINNEGGTNNGEVKNNEAGTPQEGGTPQDGSAPQDGGSDA